MVLWCFVGTYSLSENNLSKETINKKTTKKKAVRAVLWSAVALIFTLALIVATVQIPYFQTRIVQKVADVLTERTGFRTSIESVNIKWFDIIVLDEVTILDDADSVMIQVEQVAIDFDIRTLIDGRNIYLSEAQIQQGEVHLVKNAIDGSLNITRYIDNVKALFRKRGAPKSKEPPVFTISDVHLRQMSFSYNDLTREAITESFDYNHFSLLNINGDAEDFRIIADTLELMVNRLSGYEPVHDFTVHDFIGFYQFTNQSMAFRNFDLYAGNSTLRDSVVFHYDSKADLGYFNDSVTIHANIDQTELYSRDLALFAPFLKNFDEFYTVSGKFRGEVKSFTMKDFILNFGARSQLAGDVSFDGLPNIKETFTNLQLSNAQLDTRDLKQYVQDEEAYRTLRKFGDIEMQGDFLGFPNDFVANVEAATALGGIKSDINLKIEDIANYSGKLTLTDFDLSSFSPEPGLFQKTSFTGDIVGSGLSVEEADFKLNADFRYLGVNRYRYRNIKTNARFAKSFFEGALSIRDPNLKFELNGTVDLRDDKEDIVLEARLDTAYLKPLNLSSEPTFITTKLSTNTSGLKVDDLVGSVFFNDLFVSYQGRELSVDSLHFVSDKEDSLRYFNLSSDHLQAELKGNFDFSVLAIDLQELLREYKLIFSNDGEALKAFYDQKEIKPLEFYADRGYELRYNISMDNVNPLIHLLEPNLNVSLNTQLEGRFKGGYTHMVTLHSQIDTIQYQNTYFMDNQIDISTSKIVDSTEVLAMVYLESAMQRIDQDELNISTENFIFEAIWDDDHIDFTQRINQVNTDNHANVSGELRFLKDSTEISLHPSDLLVLENPWYFSDSNRVVITADEVFFNNFSLFNQPAEGEIQEIALFGSLSEDPDQLLTLKVNRFQVNNLNPLLRRNYQGEVNGFLDLQNVLASRRDSLQQLMVSSEMSITDFSINNFAVGNIISLSDWDNLNKELGIQLMVNRQGQRIISVEGAYIPQPEEDVLDLKARFQDANINILEPYFDAYFSDFGGTADGNFTITGSPQSPVLLGQGNIEDGSIRINYLNTNYTFDGGIFFDENTIGVKNLELYDHRNNRAVFNGGFFHDGFTNFVIDLEGDLQNVAVLNTALKDNDLFYGRGYATGEVSLLGAIENMDISAKVKTEKGTKIFIPIESVEDAKQSDYISFVSFDETTDEEEEIAKVAPTGVNLDLEIEITPDAYGELIFDIKTGDIIRGRGEGQLQFLLSSTGEFNMFGDIALMEGGYNFTLYNIINKEFQIQPGSTISWLGDPYGGIVDIEATYQQLASLAPLINDATVREQEEVRRRYDAIVRMDLTGDLMSPDIDFKIDVDNYPENNVFLQAAVEALRNAVTFGNEEIKRQVFSLIVLRRFSEIGSFEGGGNMVSSSVSELLSNQFSYWLSQVDENLQIDVDLGSFDEDRFNTFQLRLSYSFFDGRLRVTRDGGFTNVNNEADAASVIGDVTLEYLLTQDGKYRVKVYNRNSFNSLLNGIGAANNTMQGISLMHVESFNKVKELFTEARENNRQIVQDERPVQDSTQLAPAEKTAQDSLISKGAAAKKYP
jgi:hypothetical protein